MTEIKRSIEIAATNERVWDCIHPKNWENIFHFVKNVDGFDRLFREMLQVALFIYLLREELRSLEICKNDVAGGRKKSVVKFVFFSRIS